MNFYLIYNFKENPKGLTSGKENSGSFLIIIFLDFGHIDDLEVEK